METPRVRDSRCRYTSIRTCRSLSATAAGQTAETTASLPGRYHPRPPYTPSTGVCYVSDRRTHYNCQLRDKSQGRQNRTTTARPPITRVAVLKTRVTHTHTRTHASTHTYTRTQAHKHTSTPSAACHDKTCQTPITRHNLQQPRHHRLQHQHHHSHTRDTPPSPHKRHAIIPPQGTRHHPHTRDTPPSPHKGHAVIPPQETRHHPHTRDTPSSPHKGHAITHTRDTPPYPAGQGGHDAAAPPALKDPEGQVTPVTTLEPLGQ